jgi:8-oxo-dGTP diphosphatase
MRGLLRVLVFSFMVDNENKDKKTKRQKYCVGFLLDPTLSKVVLIRKQKPAWQQGLLNGVGGKIGDVNTKETALEAMNREFAEETGVQGLEWTQFLNLKTPHSDLSFFRAIGNVHRVISLTEEEVGVYDVHDVMDRCDTMPNLRWCIQMARTFHFGERAQSFKAEEIMEPGVNNSMGGAEGYKLGKAA